jgi:hypothetical protein
MSVRACARVLTPPVAALGVLVVCFLPGCGSELARRAAYETLQNVGQRQCERELSADCGERPSYETYQRQREEVR